MHTISPRCVFQASSCPGCLRVGGCTGVSNTEHGDPALKPPESENEVELHHSDANVSRCRFDFINFF